jgi:hypothetical protein
MPTSQNVFEQGATKVSRAIVLKGKTANFSVPMPAGFRLTAVYVKNNTANAVTGGIRIGSAAAGTQHVTALPVGASAVAFAVPNVLAAIVTTPGDLFIEAVTAFNSANLDFRIEYEEILAPTITQTVNGVVLNDPLGRH